MLESSSNKADENTLRFVRSRICQLSAVPAFTIVDEERRTSDGVKRRNEKFIVGHVVSQLKVDCGEVSNII